MTVESVVATLAKEFSVDPKHAERVFELITKGIRVPVIARFKRAEIGPFNDGTLRRFVRRMHQLEELDKRRQTLLKSIEERRKSTPDADAKQVEKEADALRRCNDRFELEDLFLPHRRPEPEVQLALDRGLEPLAELLVKPAPKLPRQPREDAPETSADEATEQPVDESEAPEAAEAQAAAEPETPSEVASEEEAVAEPAAEQPVEAEPTAEQPVETEAAAEQPVETEVNAEQPVEAEAAAEQPAAPAKEVAEPQGSSAPNAEASDTAAPGAPDAESGEPQAKSGRKRSRSRRKSGPKDDGSLHGLHIELTPELARVCAEFINPDRGIHTEQEALEGAVRILSDHLGRSPSLRGTLRRLMRKHGRLQVRALVSEKELGRNRSLLKLDSPIRQLQGHRLLTLRQAQGQRQIAVAITVDEKQVMPRVRAALGKRIKPEFMGVATAVAEQALRQRLMPMIEDEIRNELRERADEEAIRFLSQHLRQVLLAPALGPKPVAGVHIDAKGDWLLICLDRDGNPTGEEVRIEAGALEPKQLAEPLAEALRPSGVRALAVAHGKSVRAGLQKLRETIHLLQAEVFVYLVNESGISNYSNSELARQELPDLGVPSRQAVSLGRRLQDPLAELLKVDVRHLGLGREQSVISKANLRRLVHDTVESCVAYVGCDLNRAPMSLLRHMPGLSFDLAKKLIGRRLERPFASLEELRTENLLDDDAWTNAVGFLRVGNSPEPLDSTALHPEQYDLVRRMILEAGQSVEEALGRRDAIRGLKAKDFEVEEYTWRDIQREISHPGRDPRSRLFFPKLLAPDTDVKLLEKDSIVEGIVSNVTSFGAFIDLGVARDGMIHISEISSRYVRDARALLSIGQIVRARVLSGSGPRVELSLKNVPDHRRSAPGERQGGARGGSRGAGSGSRPPRGKESSAWPEYVPVQRAANTRRDGLVTGAPKGRGGGGQRGGGGGGQRGGGGGRGGQRDNRRGERDEHYDPAAVREASKDKVSFSPFASFFKEKEGEGEDS